MFLMRNGPQEAQLPAGRHMLTSTLAVEESVFETLRIKRYGRLMVLLTPAMKIITYDFNMLGYDYSVPQPVILNELGALMQQFQQFQQNAAEADSANGPKPHEVMQIAVNALANLGHGFEGEVITHFVAPWCLLLVPHLLQRNWTSCDLPWCFVAMQRSVQQQHRCFVSNSFKLQAVQPEHMLHKTLQSFWLLTSHSPHTPC